MIDGSIAQNTAKTYKTGLTAFENFLNFQKLPMIWPPPLENIVHFVSYLSLQGLSANTADSYISAIGYNCKIMNVPDVTQNFIVKKVLEGMKRLKRRADTRLPITPRILCKIVSILPGVCFNTYEGKMFQAAFTLAFWGLFRVGELTASGANSDKRILALSDIKVKDSKLVVHIRFSKTDQLGKGVTLEIPKALDNSVCPVASMTEYLKVRSRIEGPLFQHFSGSALTRYQFSTILSKCLKCCGIGAENYKSHSFRVGGCTALFMSGYSSEEIQTRGRWKSEVYRSYIRIPSS